MTAPTLTLDQVFAGSAWISNYIHGALGATADLNQRERIALTLATIALDHREAALLLVQAQARTSVLSIVRSALESYVGASWVQYSASDEALALFLDDKSPTFEKKIQALRKAHPLGELFERLRSLYKALSDYAHGNVRQISRWKGPDGIAPRHSDAEMIEALRLVDLIGMLACAAREQLAERPHENFVRLSFDVFTWVHYVNAEGSLRATTPR